MRLDCFNYNDSVIYLSPELARIVAHICADGYVSISKQKRCKKELEKHPRNNVIRKKYSVRYVNMEPVVVLRRHEYEISGLGVYKILILLGAGKSREWFISDYIFASTNICKIEWLKAFYDDESHVSVENKLIVLNCVNNVGLKQIQLLLFEFGIKSKFYGPYHYKQYSIYRLTIRRNSILKYSEVIGFNHPEKRDALNQIINKL